MVSVGENYPVINVDPEYTTDSNTGVIDVVIVNPGVDYTPKDTAFDNLQNEYKLTVDGGKIVSAQVINTTRVQDLPTITITTTTGRGAVLKPIIGRFSRIAPAEVTRIVDCPK
jgi:hypothetical protein